MNVFEIKCFDEQVALDDFTASIINAKISNRKSCIEQGIKLGEDDFKLTPQEELFAKFFSAEKIFVKDMDLLTLRAHREELAQVAFEARARLTAVDDEEKERRKKKNDGSPTGFARNLNIDETSSDAINKVKERSKRLTAMEKVKQGLIAMGMSDDEAEKIVSAKNIKAQQDEKTVQNNNKPTGESEFKNTPEQQEAINKAIAQEAAEKAIAEALAKAERDNNKEKKPFISPFDKPKENIDGKDSSGNRI